MKKMEDFTQILESISHGHAQFSDDIFQQTGGDMSRALLKIGSIGSTGGKFSGHESSQGGGDGDASNVSGGGVGANLAVGEGEGGEDLKKKKKV
jgi:hypothetical protein